MGVFLWTSSCTPGSYGAIRCVACIVISLSRKDHPLGPAQCLRHRPTAGPWVAAGCLSEVPLYQCPFPCPRRVLAQTLASDSRDSRENEQKRKRETERTRERKCEREKKTDGPAVSSQSGGASSHTGKQDRARSGKARSADTGVTRK